jgi:LPS sulfotransferase NodH
MQERPFVQVVRRVREWLAGPLRGPDGAPAPRLLRVKAADRERADADWRRRLEALRPLHDDRAVVLDPFVDATFREGDADTAHRRPWVGIVHGDDPDALLADERFAMSVNNCAGLFVFDPILVETLHESFDFAVSLISRNAEPGDFAKAVVHSEVFAALRPTAVPSFLLFAHPRSGSTTLERVLACHPEIRILGEPFNPYIRKADKQGHYRYLKEAGDAATLGRCLDGLYYYFTGIRHLMPGRPAEGRTRPWDAERINRQILERPLRRVLLSRRNRLQTVVSELMSTQTRVWQRDEGRIERPLDPLDPSDVRRRLDWLRGDVEQYREFLNANDLTFHEVFYEDLFLPDVDSEAQVARVREIFAHLGADEPSAEAWKRIRGLLDPGTTRLNSEETYRLIPNADEIDAALGGDADGRLFTR